MAFGSGFNNFFSGVYQGITTADDLKDYRHGSKLFLSDGYALAPQTKFLFHVYFTLNTTEIPGLQRAFGSIQDVSTIGMMVKTADLPKFSVDVQEMHQYNRKRYIQNKINYQPVRISFHDDGSDLVRSMWNAYYSYYYEDSLHLYDGVDNSDLSGWQEPIDFNRRDTYDNLRNVNNWGYSGTGNATGYKPNFFKDIKIYGLNRGNFTQYTLINPIITDWSHDSFDYANTNGIMSNDVTIRYETVKYARGKVGTAGDSNVKGFADPALYDDEPSMYSKPGANASLFGAGGLADAGNSIVNDLASGNILGALVTGATSYETFQDFDFGSALDTEGTDILASVLASTVTSPTVKNSVNDFIFPTATTQLTSNMMQSPESPTDEQSKGPRPADVSSNGSIVNSAWINPDDVGP